MTWTKVERAIALVIIGEAIGEVDLLIKDNNKELYFNYNKEGEIRRVNVTIITTL